MTTIREMLQEIIEQRAPYNNDPVQMALNGFEQHAEMAKKILNFLIDLHVNIDRDEDNGKT